MTGSRQTETEFLEQYDARLYERPSTCVDTVIFTVFDQHLQLLLVRRAEHPFRDQWALVGGFVDPTQDTTLEDTARRKLVEKTGVVTPYLEQCLTVGRRDRDPRGWSITTVYFALLPFEAITLQAGSGASDIKWSAIHSNHIKETLAFDHDDLYRLALERLRNKVLYTTLPAWLMPPLFTLGDLQKTHEIILGRAIETKSFRRRMEVAGILEDSGQMRHDAKRPARLYRLKPDAHTHFFLRNIES